MVLQMLQVHVHVQVYIHISLTVDPGPLKLQIYTTAEHAQCSPVHCLQTPLSTIYIYIRISSLGSTSVGTRLGHLYDVRSTYLHVERSLATTGDSPSHAMLHSY